ncbi:MAG: LapA family protein [Armatimonadetes bacterium]|nr:LapA family protein [Armatimonadota bacterium]
MRTVVALVLLVLVTIFALNNPAEVQVRFLTWRYATSLAMALLTSVVVGALLVFISSLLYQRTLHQQIRTQEQQIRRYEALLREPGRTFTPAPGEYAPPASSDAPQSHA